jgi:hypothetical protein
MRSARCVLLSKISRGDSKWRPYNKTAKGINAKTVGSLKFKEGGRDEEKIINGSDFIAGLYVNRNCLGQTRDDANQGAF